MEKIGIVLADINDVLLKLTEVRAIIEPEVARLAARRCDRKCAEEMRKALAMIGKAGYLNISPDMGRQIAIVGWGYTHLDMPAGAGEKAQVPEGARGDLRGDNREGCRQGRGLDEEAYRQRAPGAEEYPSGQGFVMGALSPLREVV
jgi:hypothetical protein